jgi:hypothetical protein
LITSQPFSITIEDNVRANYGSWDDFFNSINSGDVVVSFGSPSAAAAPVPEPATLVLLGSGLIALAGFGRKKWKNGSLINGPAANGRDIKSEISTFSPSR